MVPRQGVQLHATELFSAMFIRMSIFFASDYISKSGLMVGYR